MMIFKDNSDPSWPDKRWYDQDPALKHAMAQLRLAPSAYQAQVALNLIKIIVEHQIEAETKTPVEDLDRLFPADPDKYPDHVYRRWYDLHQILRSAIQLLQDTPEDLKIQVIPSIAQMIEETLQSETHSS